MTAPAQIPNPAHILAETMLSRRFGKETANYFSSKCGVVGCMPFAHGHPQRATDQL